MRTTEGKVFRALGIAGGLVAVLYLMVALSFVGASGGKTGGNSAQNVPTAHRLQVVTSVQVWADVAQELGGKYVKAMAIIANAGQDPHSYEATVRDQLAVNKADLTITNGGDYDPFFAKLVSKKPNATAASNPVLSNLKLATQNPHLWYDLSATQAIVAEIGKRLAAATADPVAKAAIRSNTASYQQQLAGLVQQQAATRLATEGKAVILTEGFAAPMLQHLGIIDRTPREFLNAVEEEQDASPKVMNQLKQMLQTHRVQALILNQQTEGYQTNQLVGWAKQSGVPVLRLGELLPKNQTYLQWMESNLNQIAKAFK